MESIDIYFTIGVYKDFRTLENTEKSLRGFLKKEFGNDFGIIPYSTQQKLYYMIRFGVDNTPFEDACVQIREILSKIMDASIELNLDCLDIEQLTDENMLFKCDNVNFEITEEKSQLTFFTKIPEPTIKYNSDKLGTIIINLEKLNNEKIKNISKWWIDIITKRAGLL